MDKKKPLKNPVIKDDAFKRMKHTQQIKVTDENAAKYTAAFLIKVYGRLGYMIKLMEKILKAQGIEVDDNKTQVM